MDDWGLFGEVDLDADGWATKPECQCGADAAGGLGPHSDWCPKYQEKK